MEIRPEHIFFGILLLVPAQFLLSPSETGHLKYHLNSVLFSVKQYLPEWLTNIGADSEGTEPTIDMNAEMDPDKNGAYGLGQYVRQRAPNVEFRVGDVIYHEKLQFRGVVIGWDVKAIAPEKFLQTAHGSNKHYADQPNYAVLMDTRDRLTPQMTYVAQEAIRLGKGAVMHPQVEKFFDGFNENRQKYIMRPVYKVNYPDD